MNLIISKLEQSDIENQYNFGFENLLIEESAKQLINNLQGKNILELGSGKGIITNQLISNKCNVNVVDDSDYFINHSREKNPDAKFIKSDWNNFDYSESEYSDIVIFRALSCLENPDVILKRIKSQLIGNPTIHIVITNTNSIHRKLGEKLSIDNPNSNTDRADEVGRVSNLNLDSISVLLQNLNFNIDSIQGIGLKPLPNSEMEKLSIPILKSFASMGNIQPKNAAEIYIITKCNQ